MTWLYIALVVLVVAAVAAVAVGHGEGLAVAPPDRREVSLPAGRPLTGADVAGVGLSVGLRGYRMDEVDDLLARLGAEIDERADRLRVLEAGPVETGPAGSGPVGTGLAGTATGPAAASPTTADGALTGVDGSGAHLLVPEEVIGR